MLERRVAFFEETSSFEETPLNMRANDHPLMRSPDLPPILPAPTTWGRGGAAGD